MTKDFMLVIQNVVVHCVTWTEAKLAISNTKIDELYETAIKHGAGARDGVAGALEDCGRPAMISKF